MKRAHNIKRVLRTYRNRVRTAVAPRSQPPANIVARGSPGADLLSAKLDEAFTAAMGNRHRIERPLAELAGMSGQKYRCFVNKLLSSLDDARYLEIGVCAGSTLCSALHNNAVTALGIDNWADFGGPADLFFRNLSKFCGPGSRVSFMAKDFRSVDYATIGRYNVFLYDGPHDEQGQFDGLALPQPALDDRFVFIVDDWNWPEVRAGTEHAIRELGLTVNYAISVRTTLDDSRSPKLCEASEWHNGYFLAALAKPGR